MSELRVTYSGVADAWHGVIKDGTGKIVARCEHVHFNREISSRYAGQSARDCAKGMLREIESGATD